MDINEELALQQQELERIRNKRRGKMDTERARKILNMVFLILAAIGVALYFILPDERIIALGIVGVAMVVKVVEFFLRYMF